MKSKILSLILMTAFLLSLTLVSAVAFTDSNTALTLTQLTSSKTINVTTDGLANFTITNAANANITVIPSGAIVNVSSVVYTVSSASSIPRGSHSYTFYINATNSTNVSDSVYKSVVVTLTNDTNSASCTDSNHGSLVVGDMEINVKKGLGDDDNYLYPLDEVEASFNVENSGDWDIKNAEISVCLLDKTTGKCIMDEGDMDLSDDSFDLDSGDDLDVTLTFEVDPDQLKVGNNDYTLYISATGEIDDSDSAYDGDASCSSGSEDIEIRTDDTFAVINNIFYTEGLSCGETFELSADIWNVGDKDFDDDEISFEIYSQELGIDKVITFDNGLDSFEKQSISYSVKIPANLSEKSYKLRLSVLDEDNDVMQNKEDDESQETLLISVSKCTLPAQASITAVLSEDTPVAVVGKEVIVESTIKNTGTASATYTISVTGNSDWSSADIDSETFTLGAGESKKVAITLNVNEDAEAGEQEFTIKAVSGTSTIEQKVKLTLEPSQGIMQIIKDNLLIFTIVLVILIVLVIIAIVLVVAKSPRKSESD